MNTATRLLESTFFHLAYLASLSRLPFLDGGGRSCVSTGAYGFESGGRLRPSGSLLATCHQVGPNSGKLHCVVASLTTFMKNTPPLKLKMYRKARELRFLSANTPEVGIACSGIPNISGAQSKQSIGVPLPCVLFNYTVPGIHYDEK